MALAKLKSFLVIPPYDHAEKLASPIFQTEGPIIFLTPFLGSNPPFNIPHEIVRFWGLPFLQLLRQKS